jgi:hypothetical protein
VTEAGCIGYCGSVLHTVVARKEDSVGKKMWYEEVHCSIC